MFQLSMTLSTNERTQIVIPAQGMVDVRDALTDLLCDHGLEEVIPGRYFAAKFVFFALAFQCLVGFSGVCSQYLFSTSEDLFNSLDAGRRYTDFAQTPYASGSLLTDGTVYERSG